MTSAGIRKWPRRSDAEEVATAGKSELRMERAGHKSERAPISMMFLFVSFTMVKSFRARNEIPRRTANRAILSATSLGKWNPW